MKPVEKITINKIQIFYLTNGLISEVKRDIDKLNGSAIILNEGADSEIKEIKNKLDVLLDIHLLHIVNPKK